MKRSLALACFGLLTAARSSALAQDPTCDLLTEASVPALADPNTDATFSLAVTNVGEDDAADVTLTSPIPTGLTFVSLTSPGGWSCTTPAVGSGGTITCTAALLAPAASAMFTLVLHVDAGAAAGTFFTSISTATTSTIDVNSENDSATAVLQTPPPPAADLGATLEVVPSVSTDVDVHYTVGATNAGGQDATSATLTFSIPGPLTFVSVTQTSGPTFVCNESGGTLTCTIATLPAGTAGTFDVIAHVPAGVGDGTTAQSSAVVMSDYDPNTENDAAPALLCVQQNLCSAGPCNMNTAVVCPAPALCHEPGVCAPQTGACVEAPVANDTPCDDESVCSQASSCQGGVCTGSMPLACDDGDPCTTDYCDATGGCMTFGACTEDAGADASAPDSGAPDGGGDPDDGGGCDCSAHGGGSQASTAFFIVLVLGTMALRRKRSR